jgi:hypothetical protein
MIVAKLSVVHLKRIRVLARSEIGLVGVWALKDLINDHPKKISL